MEVWSNRLVLLTQALDAPGSIPGVAIWRYIISGFHQNLDPANRRLRVSLKHFMRHFTLSPHWRPRWYVTIDGRIILSIAMNGSYSGMVPTPCTLRTWGTQAIDYSWANLMYTMPHHTPSGRTQDVDGIRRLHISRLMRPRESNPPSPQGLAS